MLIVIFIIKFHKLYCKVLQILKLIIKFNYNIINCYIINCYIINYIKINKNLKIKLSE